MRFRYLIAGLVCTGCLAFGGLSLSYERVRALHNDSEEEPVSPRSKRAVPSGKPLPLERRIEDLEKQVQSLKRELDALRKELKPAANQPGPPRPLKLPELR